MFVDIRTIATCNIHRQIYLKTINQDFEYETNIEKYKKNRYKQKNCQSHLCEQKN